MSFANQALCAEYLVLQETEACRSACYMVPEEIDQEIARLKLASMGIKHRHADGGAGALPDSGERGRVGDVRRVAEVHRRHERSDTDVHNV